MGRFADLDRMVMSMMADFGGIGKLLIHTTGTYNNGEITEVSPSEYDVNIIMTDFPQISTGEKSKFGTLILDGDKLCYLQPINKADSTVKAVDIKPNKDTIVQNKVEWKILSKKDSNPSGSDSILLELHLRK